MSDAKPSDEERAREIRDLIAQLSARCADAVAAGLIVDVRQSAVESLGPGGVQRRPIFEVQIARRV